MADSGQERMETEILMHSPPTSTEQPSALAPGSILPLPEQISPGILCSQLMIKAASICKLNFLDMFTSNNTNQEPILLDRRAFLLYHPQEHLEELEFTARWLLMHHVEVGTTWYEGSWEHFKQQILKGGSGVILV